MKLSKTSALAALAVAHLAGGNFGRIIQARQVARHLGIPTDSTLKILQCLARHNILQSQLGRGGGYRLVQPAHEVTLLQIVEAIDGPIGAGAPLHLGRNGVANMQVLHAVCQDVARRVRDALTDTTVAMLVCEPAAMAVA
ncbi:MAG: Rrf2 family transcriptional regulator [Phycisphaeraceae bacterium]